MIGNANYVNLLIADFISSLGDWMIIPIIASLFIYDIGLPSQMLAIVEIAMAAPSVFFGSIIGVSVDNKNPIPILIYSDVFRAALSIILYFSAYHYKIILLLLFLEGICRCFFLPSRQIALKVMVLNDLLPRASGFLHTSNQFAKIIGPAFGGLLILYCDIDFLFIVNAFTFLVSACFIKAISLPVEFTETKLTNNKVSKLSFIYKKLINVGNTIKNNKLLNVVIINSALRFAIIFVFDFYIIVLNKFMNFNASIYAIAISAIGVGSVVGSVIVTTYIARFRYIALISAGQIFGGLLLLLLGLLAFYQINLSVYFYVLIWLLFGITGALINIPYAILLQTEVEQNIIGSVSAFSESIQNFFMIISPLIGALLTNFIMIDIMFLLVGLLLVLLGLSLIINNQRLSLK
ncbi:MFS transporter [Wolbachia endosymbiont (group A) of Sympetrum striolatum]|uniref:MFS transporter n=1 Tax=Wolbachia endosymbiont (group A) of Sympetrum striolatum TaxID=2954061 RepID=UPI00222625D9|nr:MFS transporter [Wolbachia endosymbiont (group A) of Sympetrum striolatum]